MAAHPQLAEHWQRLYTAHRLAELGWYQAAPTLSLQLIGYLGVDRDAAILDVGAGASSLVDALRDRGYTDISVLDVSGAALAVARARAGEDAAQWLVADVLTWQPPRRYDLWHDRAAFHFLVAAADRARYMQVLRSALNPGGHVVLGTFALDAPATCSGLPVQRYDAATLHAALGPGFELLATRREVHRTPAGVAQPFTWIAARYAAPAERAARGT